MPTQFEQPSPTTPTSAASFTSSNSIFVDADDNLLFSPLSASTHHSHAAYATHNGHGLQHLQQHVSHTGHTSRYPSRSGAGAGLSAPSGTDAHRRGSVTTSEGEETDEDGNFARELEQIEQLRRNVKKNLLLRPLSTQNLRASGVTGANASAATASSVPAPGPGKASPSRGFTAAPNIQDVISPVSAAVTGRMPGSYPFSPPADAGPATGHFPRPPGPLIAIPEPEERTESHEHAHDYPPHSAASYASDVFYSARPVSTGSVSSYYFGHSPPGSAMKASFQEPGNHAAPGKLQINTETPIALEEPSPDPYGRQQFYTAKSPNSASFIPPPSFRELAYSQAAAALEGRLHPQTSNLRTASSPSAASIESSPLSSGITEPPSVYEPVSLLPVLQQLSARSYLSPRNSSFGAVSRPLLLDTRPSGSYLASRIVYSINIAIPSLILKRFRKQHQKGGTAFKDLNALRGYISTESGRTYWDVLISGKSPVTGSMPGQIWSGEIVVFDEEMDENDPLAPKQQERLQSIASTPTSTGSTSSALSTPSTAAWTLLSLLRPLTTGTIYYLKGGISAMRKFEGSDEVIVSGEWEIEESDSEEDANADGHDLEEGSDAAASSTTNSISGMTTSDSTPSTGTPSHPQTRPLKLSLSQGNLAADGSSNGLRLGSSGKGSNNLGSSPNPKLAQKGLFSIRTDVAAKHRPLPEIEPPTTSPKLEDAPSNVPKNDALRLKPPPSPRLMPPPSPRRAVTLAIDTTTPLLSSFGPRIPELKPSESKVGGHVRNLSNESNQSSAKTPQSAILVLPNSPPKQQQQRRPSAIHIPTAGSPSNNSNEESVPTLPAKPVPKPRLAKLDMSSMERLKGPAQAPEANAKASLAIDTANTISKGPPKLQLRTTPMKAHTIASDKLDVPVQQPLAMPKPKIRLGLDTLNTSNASFQSNVLIVNTPSSPDNTYLDTHFGEKRSTSLTIPPSPSAPNGENSLSRPRTPKSPLTPLLPPSPMTARPGNGPEPTSPTPVFTISTILPNFLYLGPELVQEDHVKELEGMGVRRILNLAIECDDDANLGLRERFERYVRIPMRDTVEEVNVGKAMREVCDILDDARLHSSPTYVHCKAGKSRSVTAVMAYLIHANHWTLSKAYAFVLDRRKGISPNIGFVSELMNFEEDELGGKSVGVVGGSGNESSHGRRMHHHRQQRHHHNGDDGSRTARRRPAHLRESMPPIVQSYSAMAAVGEHDSLSLTGGLGTSYSQGGFPNGGPHPNGSSPYGQNGIGPSNGGMMSAGPSGKSHVPMRDVGEDMEVRDSEGRYRHARRAPVDDVTLQPVRRVSKAGLESTWAESLRFDSPSH